MKKLTMTLMLLMLGTTTAQAEMKLSFKWGAIPKCTTGKPNRVPNPEFIVQGVPKGTTKVIFKMVDKNVPGYNHGGGTVKMGSSGKIRPGAFKYKSPCPPNGTHTYEWTATAKAGSKTVAVAKARRNYP